MSNCREQVSQIISRWKQQTDKPLVVGISGSQGSGKTTLARYLQKHLQADKLFSVARFSLDDFYKTRAERQQMAVKVHPLFATRTMPGTHDIALALNVLSALKNAHAETWTAIPVFSKEIDDRLPESLWSKFKGRPDIILFEGWCLGAEPVTAAELDKPVNNFELVNDADGRWRRAVNQYLREDYPPLWAAIDKMVFLRIPGFDSVFRWRQQQEQETFANTNQSGMSVAALRDFVEQTERVTLGIVKTLSPSADLLLQLGPDHACEIVD